MKKKPVKYNIGCSGFHYEEWKTKFYPLGLAKKNWLEYYAEHFNTVELNVTFYRTMKPAFFENLYSRTGKDFTFSVKVSRIITHYKKFNDTLQALQDFYVNVQGGLKEKLGCVLFQLPPRYPYSPEKLEKILGQMDPGFRNVIEFRDESWWQPGVYTALGKKKITFCTVSYPGLPDNLVVNTRVVYIRLHGVPVLYRSPYSHGYLETLAAQLKNADLQEAFIYFDNTDRGEAIGNARELVQLLDH